MKKELLEDLAIKGGIYDCICDPYDKLGNGDYYSSVMVDLERFAEKIVRECVTQCSKVLVEHTGQPSVTHNYAVGLCQDIIKDHFGVDNKPNL